MVSEKPNDDDDDTKWILYESIHQTISVKHTDKYTLCQRLSPRANLQSNHNVTENFARLFAVLHRGPEMDFSRLLAVANCDVPSFEMCMPFAGGRP